MNLTRESTWQAWVDALEELGSDDDPIYHENSLGPSITPSILAYRDPMGHVGRTRISYYGGKPFRLIHGTALGMVRDRKRMVAEENL